MESNEQRSIRREEAPQAVLTTLQTMGGQAPGLARVQRGDGTRKESPKTEVSQPRRKRAAAQKARQSLKEEDDSGKPHMAVYLGKCLNSEVSSVHRQIRCQSTCKWILLKMGLGMPMQIRHKM